MSEQESTLGQQPQHDPPTAIVPDASAFDEQDFLSSDGEGKSIQAYRKNQSIFVQGESAAAVFYIQRGKVKLSATSVHGKDAVVGILVAGQFFGESCLTAHQSRLTSATAMEDCLLTEIDKITMRAALRRELKLSDRFVTYLLARISRIEDDLIDQLFNSSEKRLARLLLLLANYGQEGRPPIVDVTLSQETLAEMIGTTRSRVSSFMNKFRKLGYVSYVSFSSNIKVHSSLLDSVLRDKPAIKHQD